MAALGLISDSRVESHGYGEHLPKPRAATEGRPYSTFRSTNASQTDSTVGNVANGSRGPCELILTFVSLVSILHSRPRVWKVEEVPVAFWAWRTQSPDESMFRKRLKKQKRGAFSARRTDRLPGQVSCNASVPSPDYLLKASSCISFTTQPAPFSSSSSRSIRSPGE